MTTEITKRNNLFEHNGFQYDTVELVNNIKAGATESQAVRYSHPDVPTSSIKNIVAKLRKQPYYIAYKDYQLSILKDKGPDLQQNLLTIALEGRSERNRLDATVNALDRVYGAEKNEINPPNFVFNFSFNNSDQPRAKIIEGEVIDG